jgi:hypothetical protein
MYNTYLYKAIVYTINWYYFINYSGSITLFTIINTIVNVILFTFVTYGGFSRFFETIAKNYGKE